MRRYLPHIDGLRGIAVLSVILYHLSSHLLPGGFVGVDVFFVISGFVVSRSTSAAQVSRFGALLASFYAHRVARIVPALVACLVATFLASCLFIPESWLSGSNEKTGLHAFLGFSNMVLARAENDYFAPKAGYNPFTHSWSLGVEEQFYLGFPCMFAVWLWGKRGLSATLFGAGLLASLACALILSHVRQSDAFYFLLSRFWELAAGVLLLQLVSAPRMAAAYVPARVLSTAAWLGLACIAFSLISATPDSTPFPGSLLPCLGTVCILGSLERETAKGATAALLGWPPLRYVGRISYSLYLWHWPIFVLFRWTVGLEAIVPRLMALALVFAFSIASFRWIETPFRVAFARTGRSNRFVLACGVVTLLGGYGVSSALLSLRPMISLSTVTRHKLDWYQDFPKRDAAYPGCSADLADLHLPGAEAWVARRTGCDLPVRFAKTLFVLGDSHATAYTVMLRDFVRHTGATLYLYSVGGCSFLGISAMDSANCRNFDAVAEADISRRLKSGDVIFLPSLRIPRLVEEYAYAGPQAAMAAMFAPEAARRREANFVAALPVLKGWRARGAAVMFEAPTPVLPSPPFRCADWFNAANPICRGGSSVDRATILALRAPVMAQFQQLGAVSVWDPLAVLCPGEVCSAYQDGRPLFFDGDHLSGYGNRALEKTFEAQVSHLAEQNRDSP